VSSSRAGARRPTDATVAHALDHATGQLSNAGCPDPRVDSELLLAHVLQTTRAGLYAESRRELTADEERELRSLLDRRARREPLAYVLGEWGFRRLALRVDARVLVPRPETEVVVERCLALLAGTYEPRVLDVGTGSGAIALSIADEHRGARVTGIDSSPDALEVARENALLTGLDVELTAGDLFRGLPGASWDLVVSNPPYVSPAEIELLEPEVRDWEPRAALVADGATEAVARSALAVLRSGGALVLEVSASSAGNVADLLGGLGFGDVRVTRDLAGRERVVEGLRQ
jgi:release factor glutamine methyltransferase